MSRARTAQCALLYKGWSGIVEWQEERRRREGHEVNESVADVAVDEDSDAGRKTAGDCTVSRCRFPIPFHRSLSQTHTLEVPRQRVAHGLAHMTRNFFSGFSISIPQQAN